MNPILDIVKYRSLYRDLEEAFGDNWDLYVWHFFTYGVKEHRDNGTDFDLLAYLEAYGDVADAFGTDYEAVARHYVQYGIQENRQEGSKAYIQEREEKAAAEAAKAAEAAEAAAVDSGTGSTGAGVDETGSAESGNTGETDSDKVVVDQRTSTLENGYTLVAGYNAKGQLIKATFYDTNNALLQWATYQYDAAGNTVNESQFDASGNRTEYNVYEYNANGKMTKASYYDAEGPIGYRTCEYDAAGNLIKETYYYGSGVKESYKEYDASGNNIRRTDYNAAGKVTFDVAYIYEGGTYKGYQEIRYVYDGNGNLTKKSCSNKNSGQEENKDYLYDAAGNVTKESTYKNYNREKLLSCIDYVYENGQLVSATKSEYDENGTLISTTPIS